MAHLDPRALSKLVAARKLAPVYLLHGDDIRAIDAMIDAIEATVDPADQPFAVERLYAMEDGGRAVDIAASARVYPMLGDRRIVIVLRAERLLKPKRAAKAAESGPDDEAADESAEEVGDVTPLEDYLERPSPSTTLIFVAAGIDRTRRFTKKLLAACAETEFASSAMGMMGARPGGMQGPAWLHEELDRVGRTIDPGALQLLLQRSANDVTKLRGDLDRLLLYTDGQPRISRDDVAEIATDEQAVEDEWGLVNAVAAGQAKEALREIAKRLDRGDSPHAVLGQLRWWVSNKLVERDAGRVRAAIDALWRTDLALKSSGGDDRVLMERLVVELSGK